MLLACLKWRNIDAGALLGHSNYIFVDLTSSRISSILLYQWSSEDGDDGSGYNPISIITPIFCRSIGEMDSTGSVSAVEAALDRLSKQRSDLEELWSARKLRLDMCLRLRLFERDALEVLIPLIYPLPPHKPCPLCFRYRRSWRCGQRSSNTPN